jgi:phosphatidylinositol glycan class B
MKRFGFSFGLFAAVFCIKLIVSFANKSYFIPDEVWQSQEVAHYFIFGQGFLTWEWKRKIRSFAYPFFLSCFYWTLKVVGLDSGWSLQVANKVFGSLIAASTDCALYSFALEAYGREVANCALLLSLGNSFNFTHQTRTLINNFESLLNALFWLSFCGKGSKKTVAIYIAAFGCVVRPTFAINCIVPLILLLVQERKIGHFVLAALGFLGFSFLFDYAFYKELMLLTWWNFCKFNAIDGLSSFYGTNGYTWYLLFALPVMSNVALLPFAMKAITLWKTDLTFRRILFQLILPVIAVYSMLKHKEVRFLYQLQPFFLMFCACALQKFSCKNRKMFWWCYLLFNIPIAVHFARIHQVGPLNCLQHVESLLKDEMKQGKFIENTNDAFQKERDEKKLNFLNSNSQKNPNAITIATQKIFFLCSCHVSPYYGYFHNSNLNLEMITCNPPERAQELHSGIFENEMLRLFKSPLEYTSKLFATFTEKPHILIVESELLEGIREFLTTEGYSETKRFPRSLLSLQDKSREDLVVFKLANLCVK